MTQPPRVGEQVSTQLRDLIRNSGHPITHIARTANIDRRTFYRRLEQGNWTVD